MKYEQLKRKVAQDDDNRARDARFLSEMQLQWDSWMKYIANSPLNLTQTSDRKQYFSYEGKIRPYEYEGLTYARIYENNHERLASSKDIQAVSQNSEGAKYIEVLKRMPVYRFISSNMPKTKQMIDNAQNSSKLFASMEKPNFFKGQKLILEDDIKKAKLIVDSTKIDSDNYKKNLQEAAEILGLEIKFPQKEINKSNIYYVNLQSSTGSLKTLSDSLISDYKGFELGAKYVEAYEKIAKLIIDKRNSILEKDKEKQNIKEGQEKIKDWELKLTNLVNKAKIQKDYNSLDKIYQEFWALKGDYFKYDYTYYKSVSFESHLKSAEQTFIGLFAKFENKENKAKQAIADMYKSFKEAYEQKSDYGVMALISNGWESSDGTTLMDLEDNFRNMFSIYDAIIYSISNLSVEKLPNGKYIANYDIEITGKNFDMGIERKEKSSVSEEVILEKNSYRINRTLNGRFWYRE